MIVALPGLFSYLFWNRSSIFARFYPQGHVSLSRKSTKFGPPCGGQKVVGEVGGGGGGATASSQLWKHRQRQQPPTPDAY